MKRYPNPLWDRQGVLIFRPAVHGLPKQSTPHSRKTVQSGDRCKRL